MTPTCPPPPRRARAGTTGTLRLRGVGHVYGARTPWEHRALAGVDIDVASGEGLLVLGRNGSGKSTLAWVMAGLLVPTEGGAWLDGQPLHRCVGKVGLSFQHARLQLLRSRVREDVRAAAGVDHHQADTALELVGLDPGRFGDRRVDELSGGQQRRAALAGVLATRPPVLVLDEPFAGMDATGRAELIEVLARLRELTGTSLVVVSHDTEGADRVVDRAITLDRGRIVSIGEPVGSRTPVRAGATASTATPAAGTVPGRAFAGAVGDGPGAARAVPACDGAAPACDNAVPARDAVLPASVGAIPSTRSRRRAGRDLHLLRPVPVDSPVHRLWAGTKLLALLGLALTLSVQATWAAIAAMGALVAVGLLAGRIPLGARPRLPAWFWGGIALTAIFPLLAGGAPVVHVLGTSIGLAGLATWARLVALAFVVLLAAALVSWTTPLGGVAPALTRLARPGRRLGLPVDEWAATLGLGLRSVPLLLDEIRVLAAVTRLRAPHQPQHDRLARWAVLPGNLLLAAMVVGIRRAREMGTAIEARGGLWSGAGAPRRIADEDEGPGWHDLLALAVVAVAVAVAVVA